MARNYYGFCGSCIYCELGTANRSSFSKTSFRCSKNGYAVNADERPCSKYEPDRTRTNDIIARYAE